VEHPKSAILSFDNDVAKLLADVLLDAGYPKPERSEDLGVARLGSYSPEVLMIDCDHLRSDKLESIRQLRFVLPNCSIAVVSSNLKRKWAKRCHMAGANVVLYSGDGRAKLAAGLKRGVDSGCYTDPGFAREASEN
jgi:DNA-binding NarL/FixJ family response regulator